MLTEITIKVITEENSYLAEQRVRNALGAAGIDISEITSEEISTEEADNGTISRK